MNIVASIPRLYTAIAEWTACLIYILLIRNRLKGWKFAGVAAIALGVQIAFLELTRDLPIVFWIPCMAIAVLLMLLFISVSCTVHKRDAAYYCVRAFVLAELLASLVWQIHLFFQLDSKSSIILSSALLVSTYLGIGIIVWRLENRHFPQSGQLFISKGELISAIIIGVSIFFISNISFLSYNTPFSGRYPSEILNIRTMVGFSGFAILYAHFMLCCQVRSQRESDAMQNILHNQYAQYRLSYDSIDLINQKYHDLKHQIEALRGENDSEKRMQWLDEMERDIKTYEAQNKTGNTILDTVLTSKSLYCQKQGITLTCVADGTLLDFMNVMDICTIFGNALDNAIESAQRIDDPEKRLIHVSISRQRDFVLLRFENYYEGMLQFNESLPITIKKDTVYHGYGLKSIRQTALKYNGTMQVTTENQWFVLTILIPITNGLCK